MKDKANQLYRSVKSFPKEMALLEIEIALHEAELKGFKAGNELLKPPGETRCSSNYQKTGR